MRVRVVTWNIHKGVGSDLRYCMDRITEVLAACEPDVVALQEAFLFHGRHGGEEQPAILAERLGLEHRAVGWNVPRRRGVYGNATLSRLPLGATENICLKWGVKKQRSALYTRVQAQGRPLHLFNVHLGLAHFERKDQMAWVAGHCDTRAGDDEPVVILGDTNDWSNRLHRQTLAGSGFTCATGREGRRPHPTYPSWLPVGALDRVYHRGPVRVVDAFPARDALARRASDHLPVIADLELEARPETTAARGFPPGPPGPP